LHTIRAVAAEGNGSKEAAQAWRELVKSRAQALPEIFSAFDDANPLAANYLRSAIETIVQRELDKGGKLPAEDLERFVRDTKRDPRGRRLAYELLAGVDPSAPDRLIPGMLNDPGIEFRRDAVARLVERASKQLAAGDKDDARRLLVEALSGARDEDQVQAIKKQLDGLGEKVDLPRHFGFLMSWRLVAPFDNTDKKGLAAVYPPEKELDLSATYEGKEGKKIAWVEHTTENENGIVDLAKTLGPFKGAVAYAATEFQSEERLPVEFRLGTPNSWKVWLNGELIFAREEYHRGMNLDQYKMRGTLKPGKNVILIKVCQNEQTEDWAQRWQFQFRVCDAVGTAILSADRGATLPKPAAGGSD
ncbi:MAG: hypothetical protein ACM3U2_11660, partial [Deltaproteobacteria bacterium]